MPELVVGATRIPYEVRYSTYAKRRRVVLTPNSVEIVVPAGQPEAEVSSFVQRRRQWIYDEQQKLREKEERQRSTGSARFISGAKVLYRGRMMRLRVTLGTAERVKVTYRNGFYVDAPAFAEDQDIQAVVEGWFDERVKADVHEFVRTYSDRLGVTPRAVRVMLLKKVWGSCGVGGIIHVNSALIRAPRPVLEYSVVHELCHLRHRDHSSAFWRLVGTVLPDYHARRDWLTDHEDILEVCL